MAAGMAGRIGYLGPLKAAGAGTLATASIQG